MRNNRSQEFLTGLDFKNITRRKYSQVVLRIIIREHILCLALLSPFTSCP